MDNEDYSRVVLMSDVGQDIGFCGLPATAPRQEVSR
jgi:hypothetical protein